MPITLGGLLLRILTLDVFLENNDIGRTSFVFDLEEGHGLTFEKLRTKFKSEIAYVEYNGNRITDIKANGLYTDENFDGEAWFNDPDVDFTFNGQIDFKPELPKFDFVADIKNINLSKLKLDTTDTKIIAKMDIKMTGSHADNLTGYAKLSDIQVSRGGQDLVMEKLNLESAFDTVGRKLSVQSDYINGDLQGVFSLNNLNRVYDNFLYTLFPDFYEPVVLDEAIQAKGRFEIKENDLVSYWTPYDVRLGNGILNIDYDTKEESMDARGRFDRIGYEKYVGETYDLVVRKRPHQLLNLSSDVAKVTTDDQLVTTKVVLNATILPNYIEFLLDAADTSDIVALRSFGALAFGNDSVSITMEKSSLYLDKQHWVIGEDNSALYAHNKLTINDFVLQNSKQVLRVRGILSDRKSDRLVINTSQLDLSSFNPLLTSLNIQLGGISDDSIGIYQCLKRPIVHGNLDIKDLAVNGDTLGDFEIRTVTDKNPLVMHVEAQVTNGLLKEVEATGKVDMRSVNGSINMNIIANGASVKPMELWFKGIASDFSGVINGKVRVYGSLREPRFKGDIVAKDVNLVVDYLKYPIFD